MFFTALNLLRLTLKHSLFFTDHIFTVPGSLARKLLPHTELKQDQLRAFMSQPLQKAWEKKNPTAVISCDRQSKSSAANQRAYLHSAPLGSLLPPSVVLAEMEGSTRITSVPQGCTKTGGHTGPGPHLLQNGGSRNEVNVLLVSAYAFPLLSSAECNGRD